MSELKPCPFCGGKAKQLPSGHVMCGDWCISLFNKSMTVFAWNTRTQSQWIEQELTPAIKKCFKSLIGCDGVLMVAVDDYNELVKVLNKRLSPKEQGQ